MENGWNDAKCKEVFDNLMDKYLVSKDLKWNFAMAKQIANMPLVSIYITGDTLSGMNGNLV
jgi:hypothetical protein